eukprot:scaffold171683_cov31-Tisochrysis_lutea.AAC.2
MSPSKGKKVPIQLHITASPGASHPCSCKCFQRWTTREGRAGVHHPWRRAHRVTRIDRQAAGAWRTFRGVAQQRRATEHRRRSRQEHAYGARDV